MKKLLILLILATNVCTAQYHVQVEPNPVNDGKVNPMWVNNYVISFTLDNWKTKELFKSQQTYYGYDDNNKIYYTSYFNVATFQKKNEAVAFAKRLKSAEATSLFLRDQLLRHHRLTKKYKEDAKQLCFGCKKSQTVKETAILIY